MEYNILRDWLSNHQFTWEKLGDILTYHHNAPILFSSGLFFFLFIGFLMIYMSLRKHTLARIIYVTLFSLYFYYKSRTLVRAAGIYGYFRFLDSAMYLAYDIGIKT